MDLSKLENTRISHSARSKIINDFFPNMEDIEENISGAHLSIHAAALSIYAAILTTKIHENGAERIHLESNQREQDYIAYLKRNPKYASTSDKQIESKAYSFILKDIRNSFAHGNFNIAYDKTKKDLYFVLYPQRFDINTPIIMSADAIKDAIMEPICEKSLSLMSLGEKEIYNRIDNNITDLLKTIMLPMQMINIADRYLEPNKIINKYMSIPEKRYLSVKHLLLVSQITYEQDDYYHIFGTDSDLFKKIALIRNSIAHDSFLFADWGNNIDYKDKNKGLNETLINSVIALTLADSFKELIKSLEGKGHSDKAINELKNKLLQSFEFYFANIKEPVVEQNINNKK